MSAWLNAPQPPPAATQEATLAFRTAKRDRLTSPSSTSGGCIPDIAELKQTIARLLSTSSGDRLLLSQLGAALHKEIEDFDVTRHGYESLQELLLAHPDLGLLVRGEADQQWWLIRDIPRLVRPWWAAITDLEPSHRYWYDMDLEELTEDAELVSKEPHRFMELPRFTQEAVLRCASSWLDSLEDEAVVAGLRPLLDDESNPREFFVRLREHDLKEDWYKARVAAVVELALEWADTHGVDRRKILEPPKQPPRPDQRRPESPPPVRPSPASTPANEERYRRFVHEVVEQMTWPELLQIAIPGRFLV